MNVPTSNIIDGLKSGSNHAYSELYRLYYPRVAHYIVKNSGTSEDARDIFQEVLIVLAEKLKAGDFILTASLKTYLLAITKNIWLKKLRSRYGHLQEAITERHSNELYCEITLQTENESTPWERLKTYMARITTHCSNLLHALFFRHKTISDIQQVYGYSSRHNAQNQKHKCIEQVRRAKAAAEKEKNKTGLGDN